MNLRLITCSGANETTDIEMLVKMLASYRRAEIGVQVSEKKCYFDSLRMMWIQFLVRHLAMNKMLINASLHINQSWVEDVGQGILSHELQYLLSIRNIKGEPFFQRVQLNFKIGRDSTPDAYRLLNLMQWYKPHRFIFPYNEENAAFIKKMYSLCQEVWLRFDVLYDESHGEGIVPKQRQPAVFTDVMQGYAGGIGPDNVADVLDEVALAQKKKSSLFGVTIDAEGKLKNADGHFDIELCQRYLQAAYEWRSEHLS